MQERLTGDQPPAAEPGEELVNEADAPTAPLGSGSYSAQVKAPLKGSVQGLRRVRFEGLLGY